MNKLKRCVLYIYIHIIDIYTYIMEYYLAIKKNAILPEILPFAATWMYLETIILNEVNQKDKYYMISLICRT